MRRARRRQRILAIDPTTRGFGFVVLEGANRLVDWGVRDIREDKTRVTLEKLRELICLYRVDVLVAEDCADPSSRRGLRTACLITDSFQLAEQMQVKTRAVSVWKVKAAFTECGAATKQQMTAALARRFPELLPYRPPVRKPRMSEDERQAIFDAAAFGLAYF